MIRPARTYLLPAGFECRPAAIDQGVWQDHLLRHPLGLHGKKKPWNDEAWDRTKPPVITGPRRDKLLRTVAALTVGGATCRFPDIAGKPRPVVEPTNSYCERCPHELREACARACTDDGVSDRYGALLEEFLGAVEEGAGELVTRSQLMHRLLTQAGSRAVDEGIFVMSWGFAAANGRSPVVRISRGDGTRIELYVRRGKQLAWRTTFRTLGSEPTTTLASNLRRFLGEFPTAATSMGALSEQCVVPRPWWRSHAR